MLEGDMMTGWIGLFYGLHLLAAGLGEWRFPGMWIRVIEGIQASDGQRFLAGVVCQLVGIVTLFANAGKQDELINKVIIVMASWLVVEGLFFIALPDIFGRVTRWLVGSAGRIWAVLAMLAGITISLLGVLHNYG